MVTRREFLLGGAVVGAGVLGAGVLGAGRMPANARANGPPGRAYTAPRSIDNTGATNVSAKLTNWLVSSGPPGSVLKLRRRAGYAPGVYWVPQGINFRRHDVTLDLNGCWLLTGFNSGAEFAPLWPHQSDRWPRNRYTMRVSGDRIKVFSSVPNALIWGGNNNVKAGGAEPPFVAYAADREAQHGLQLDRPNGPVEIDLTNIEIAYTFGDGIYIAGPHDVRIKGSYNDGGDPLWTPSGGAIKYGSLWAPRLPPRPGIHHVGRQGIALVDVRNCDVINVPLWSVTRSVFDLEPTGSGWTVDGVRIVNGRQGARGNAWVAALGAGWVRNVNIRDNVSLGSITVNCVPPERRPRTNWTILRNRGLRPHRSVNSPIMRFWHTRGIQVIGNLQDRGTHQGNPLRFGPGTSNITVAPDMGKQFP
ncbi:MAG: hypothetical protein ACRDWD_09690 [Acidimicrobiia bacterium]